jgi:hypothetical protein
LQIVARDVDLQYFGFEVAGAAKEREDFLIVLGQVLGGEGNRVQQKNEE